MEERLQKIISRAGIASRRLAEQLILSGAVTVNGKVITELGQKADAERDHITVGPRVVRIDPQAAPLYFAFYKPPQVVSTMNDPEGRPCLGPYLRGAKGRLFPVGRLEFDASGLILLTSDGVLASDLMRAAGTIPQVWRFKVRGHIPEDRRQQIEREANVQLRLHREGDNPWYETEIANAARDIVRQTLSRRGVFVEKSVRSGYAGIDLGPLPPGEMRELSPEEVIGLRRSAQGRTGHPMQKPVQKKAPAPQMFRPKRPDTRYGVNKSGSRDRRGSRPWSPKPRPDARRDFQGSRPSPGGGSGSDGENKTPGRPTYPPRSGQPFRPTGPGRPFRPDRPGSAHPPKSGRPFRPGGPDRPSSPGKPFRSGGPGGPNRPDRPGSPYPPKSSRPFRPSGGDRPAGPGRPFRSGGPSGPSRPHRPGSSYPSKSGRPFRPSGPSERPDHSGPEQPPRTGRPFRPGGPDKSGGFGRPVGPSRPSRPFRPNRPSGPRKPRP